MSRGRQAAVCRYFLEGRCSYGDRCRFRHPSSRGGGRGYEDQSRQPDPGFNTGRRGDHRGSQNRFHLFSDDSFQDGDNGGSSEQYSRNSFQNQQHGTRYGNQGGSRSRRYQDDYGSGSNQYSDSQGYNDRYSSGRGYQRGGGGGRRHQEGSSRYDGGSRYGEAEESPDADDLAAIIQDNMREWKENAASMWPFSCYGARGSEKSLPGFVEFSQEELRWEAYCANTAGAPQSYKDSILKLGDEQMKTWQTYASITAADAQKILDDEQTSLFSGSSLDTSNGAIGASSMFLPSATAAAAPKPAASDRNPFKIGSLASTRSLFSQAQQTGSSLFPTSPPPPAIIAGNAGLGSLLFQAPSHPQTASLQTTIPVTASQQDPTSAPIGPASTASVSSGGEASAVEGGGRGGGEGELTAEEIEAFKADKFVLGHIPEKPPPEVFC